MPDKPTNLQQTDERKVQMEISEKREKQGVLNRCMTKGMF
jgi:hypothetical protein